MFDTAEAVNFDQTTAAEYSASDSDREFQSYYAAAQDRFMKSASDTWIGRVWVSWKMMTYDPAFDDRVPEKVRKDLWWSSQ